MSAPILHLAVSQRPVFLLNSRLDLFTAALSGFNTLSEHPFSRSYGVILPSSLTRVLPIILGFSPRLPVSVCGTGTSFLTRGFSWQCRIRDFGTKISLAITAQPSRWTDLPIQQPNCLDALFHQCAHPTLLRPPIVQTERKWYRNINLLSIAYAFQPRLRPRLTLSGRAFLRKP